VDVFVNARTDVYLRGIVPENDRTTEVLRRAERYRAAGADSLFVPCVTAPDDIAMMATEARLPLNVLAWAGLPSAAELKRLGVRRLSAGSGLAQALYGMAKSLTVNFLKSGDSQTIATSGIPYTEINELML
jgi:2-methylisocitrate lyase-like PEP mutase family enzyme